MSSLVKCESCGKKYKDEEMLFAQTEGEGKWFCKDCDKAIKDMYEDYATRFNIE